MSLINIQKELNEEFLEGYLIDLDDIVKTVSKKLSINREIIIEKEMQALENILKRGRKKRIT